MQTYDVSADGTSVVFVAADDTTRSPLWFAPLDGRSPPRRLVRSDALQAFFGAGDEVIFSARERDRNFIFRVKTDGSELRKVVQGPTPLDVSPDGKWIAGSTLTETTQNAAFVYPVDGGSPTLLCRECGPPPSFERGPWPPPVSWSPDGRFIYLNLYRFPYAIPLRPNQALPELPPSGLRTDDEVAALPGARRIPEENAFVGPDPALYAFTRIAIQRNIFRVPVK